MKKIALILNNFDYKNYFEYINNFTNKLIKLDINFVIDIDFSEDLDKRKSYYKSHKIFMIENGEFKRINKKN